MKAKNFDIVPHSLSHLNQIACIVRLCYDPSIYFGHYM